MRTVSARTPTCSFQITMNFVILHLEELPGCSDLPLWQPQEVDAEETASGTDLHLLPATKSSSLQVCGKAPLLSECTDGQCISKDG